MLFIGALLNLILSVAALDAHARKTKSSGGLRGLARSNRHLSMFRAAEAQAQAPVYVQTIGMANITEPTAFPPPPPQLEPWKDNQPLDTRIGFNLIKGFIAQPTATPPPTQATLDLVFACPLLMGWPQDVAVSAPNVCKNQRSGQWTGVRDKKNLIQWQTACTDVNGTLGFPSATALTTYTISGFLFGSSLERKSPFGNYIDLRDCGGATIYTVEEKVYKQLGEAHYESCDKFKSCDGIVYIQYFIKDATGTVVAQTGYTHIFESSFAITDTAGVTIARVMRNGWDPPIQKTCAEQPDRDWYLKFEKTPPGRWAVATNQWPIAAMMTMLAQRDETRQPNGAVAWGNCEVAKSMGLLLVAAAIGVCGICVPCFLFIICAGPCKSFFFDLESRVLPKRMSKPSGFGMANDGCGR